jgi:hypothetical protein
MADTANILQFILYSAYYLAIGALAIFSLFGVYLLAAHGRSRLLSLAVSLVYIVIFLSMLGVSQVTLHGIF